MINYPWGDQTPYYSFNWYLKQNYNHPVRKVTVDAGFTCPNRDGTVTTGGCTYCNNDSFNPSYNDRRKSLRWQIDQGIDFLSRRYGSEKYMVYFQPYSNTHAPLEELRQLYEEALQVPDVIGLTIGTRPDCVDEAKLDYLAELGRQFDVTIEYGLESISDTTLQRINRGHDVKAYETAMRMSAERGLKTCTHIIIGFPWEEETQWLETAAYLSEQKTTFLKVHQLHVVKNTAMAKEYQRMPFHVFGYEEYRQFLLKFIARLSPEIVLQRLAGEAPPNILIAPKWNVQMGSFIKDFRELCRQENIWQGKDYKP